MQKTIKFNQNCISSVQNIKQIVRIIQQEQAQLTVIPAMEGTKNAVQEILNDKLYKIDWIENKFKNCIEQLLENRKNEAINELEKTIKVIKTSKNPEKINAQTQILTAKIIGLYAKEIGMNAEMLYAPDIIYKDQNGKPRVEQIMLRNDVYYITQAAICRDYKGDVDTLQNDGDNYSAMLMGAAINSQEVQVWGNEDMLRIGDQNIVEGTRAIEQMSYAQAAELAYFDSSMIQPNVLLPCANEGIDVVFKNIYKPQEHGTRISGVDNPENFLVAAAKDSITLIRVTADKMLMSYGYLRKITNIFEKYQTSVGLITTTEFAIAMTVDNPEFVEDIVAELKKLGEVEVEPKHSIVCIIGNMAYQGGGIAATMFDTVNKTPIKMISYGASNRSISLLIESRHKREMLQNINLLFR